MIHSSLFHIYDFVFIFEELEEPQQISLGQPLVHKSDKLIPFQQIVFTDKVVPTFLQPVDPNRDKNQSKKDEIHCVCHSMHSLLFNNLL